MLQQVLYDNSENSCPTPLCSWGVVPHPAIKSRCIWAGIRFTQWLSCKQSLSSWATNIQRSCSIIPWLLHPWLLLSSDTSGPMVARRGSRCQMGTEVRVWLAELSKLKRLPWYVTAISHQQTPDQRRQSPSDAKCCSGFMIYGHIPHILKSSCLATISCFLDWWRQCRGWPGWDIYTMTTIDIYLFLFCTCQRTYIALPDWLQRKSCQPQ